LQWNDLLERWAKVDEWTDSENLYYGGVAKLTLEDHCIKRITREYDIDVPW
jgi:hypothetical protein